MVRFNNQAKEHNQALDMSNKHSGMQELELFLKEILGLFY